MAAARNIERILREVGAAQHGVAGRAQLIAHGIKPHAIDRMIRSARLVVLLPGVYQIGPLPQARSAEMSAVLRCGADCRVSHMSAAVMRGLIAAAGPRTVELTMPRRRRRRIEGVRIHRVRDLRPDEVTMLDGMPVTTHARTLLDMAETLSARDMEQALAKALRLRVVTPEDVCLLLERHPGHRGAPLLRQLLSPQTVVEMRSWQRRGTGSCGSRGPM
jgi:predicted transcriptional regulator of viral defense system